MLRLLLVLSAIFASSITALDVPHKQFGFPILGNRSMGLYIDMFYDNVCSDCAANWPMLSHVITQSYLRNVLGVSVHIFPLPYHHNSFFSAWAGEAVMAADPTQYSAYMTHIFKNYDDFITKAVNMTEPEVQQKYAEAVETSTTIKREVILNGYKNRELDLRARYAWKYGCSRGVSGTPTFFVNDVVVPEASGFSFDDWNKFLQSLISKKSM